MSNDKETFKKWMKKNKLSREWLAEKCYVEKTTVNGWFRTAGKIPAPKMEQIKNVMAEYERNTAQDDRRRMTAAVPVINGIAAVAVPLSSEDLAAISEAAGELGISVEEFLIASAMGNIRSGKKPSLELRIDAKKYDQLERYAKRQGKTVNEVVMDEYTDLLSEGGE